MEGFDQLREDTGLAEMLGHKVPAPKRRASFLYQFHDEAKIEQAQQELPVDRVADIAGESAPLEASAAVNQDMVRELGGAARSGGLPPSIWTPRSSAFQALPPTIEERYFRGDSACEEESLLIWLRDETHQEGPSGVIGFAVL